MVINYRSPRGAGLGYSAGNTGLSRLALENDQKEYQLSKQLKIGQRALIQIKKSSNFRICNKPTWVLLLS